MAEKKIPDSVALIKLDGTMVKIDGTEKASSFFDFLKLPEDTYSDIAFTPEEALKIKRQLQRLSTGANAATPMICGGAGVCPFALKCPYVQADFARRAVDPSAKGLTPVGRECLVEIDLMNQWTAYYANDYQIEEGNFTDWLYIRELAGLEMLLWRVNVNLAKHQNAGLTQETIVGFDKDNHALTRTEISALYELQERLSNRKQKIIKLMVGDRQEQYKKAAALRERAEDDVSSSAAKLRLEFDKIRAKTKKLEIQLAEQEGRVIEVQEKPLTPEDMIKSSSNDTKKE